MTRPIVLAVLVIVAITGGMYARAAADDAAMPGTAPALDWAAYPWTGAETPLPPMSSAIEDVKAGPLAYLWSWEGNIGTYVDGWTQIELVPAGDAYDVRVLDNFVDGLSDACLIAQVKLGTLATLEDVDAACADLPMNGGDQ